jgi:catecholate siderophore receptor
MIFGRGGGGGIVNRVTKRAVDGRFAHAALSSDTRGAWYAQGDLNMPLGKDVAARLNGVYEEFDNFRDYYEGHRTALNPTFGWTPGESTRIDASFEYSRDRRLVDRGVPSTRAGTIADPAGPIDGYDRTLFGDPAVNRTRFDGRVGTLFVEHRFSDALRLSSKALYGHYDKFYRNVMAQTPVTLMSGIQRVGLEAYQSGTVRKNLLIQNDLVGEFATGPAAHTLLVGADISRQSTHADRQQGFFAPSAFTTSSNRRYFVPLAEQVSVPQVTFSCNPSLGCNDIASRGHALGLYVQDQARIGEHLEIVAGLRRDRFALDVDNRLNGAHFERTDAVWSPRLGLVVKPRRDLSFYASVSRSFLPQSGDQFGSLDVTTAALEPERFTNREVGVKWSPLPKLDVALAAYRLDRTNTRATDPLSGLTVLSGEQRSKGVELTVQGETGKLSVSGGAALQNSEIRRTTTAAPAGRKVALVPRFQASLWGRYDFTDRLGAGLGLYHQSDSFASISNTVVLPAFTRLDAAAFIGLSKAVELQLNVENLLDRDYTGLAFNDNNLTPANPRTARATVRLKL